MGGGLTIAAGGAILAFLLGLFTLLAVAIWLANGIDQAVRNLPFGDRLAGLLHTPEQNLVNACRYLVGAAVDLLVFLDTIVREAFQALWNVLAEWLNHVVSIHDLWFGEIIPVLTLSVLPPVERDIPAVFRRLGEELKSLPEEPPWPGRGPLEAFLRWLSDVWGVVSRLGRFARVIGGPILFVLGLLEVVIDLLHPLLTLPSRVAQDEQNAFFVAQQQLKDEALIRQLFTLWNQVDQRVRTLEIDLRQEVQARQALAVQTQQALQAATAALQTQIAGVGAQVSPLLVLGVLASLGAAGLQVLRKTAQCDPCGRLDLGDWSDLPSRVEALENFGP